MMPAKLTVVIPTRERADVLVKSLATAVAQDFDGLQILVSDNFSSDRTEEVIHSANDPRIRYVNPGRRLSMAHHWEFALSQVQGGWVTIIGDDDGLLPGALQRAMDLAEAMGVDALRSRVCEYFWPSLTGTAFGSLRVPLGGGDEIRDCGKWLEKVLQGGARYSELPMLYNGGFVKVSVLDRLRVGGMLYRSCAPDVYSAAAIASVLPRYGHSNVPLAINGASKHSTGTSYFTSVGATDPTRMFLSELNIPYHDDLPMTAAGDYPRSLQTAFYEAYLQSSSFRPAADGSRHAEQLEIVLSQAAHGDAALRGWAALFASYHGLDLAQASSRAARRRGTAWLEAGPSFVAAKLSEFRLGSSEVPLRDVEEAALTADAVLRAPPSRLKPAGQLLKRLLRKLAHGSAASP